MGKASRINGLIGFIFLLLTVSCSGREPKVVYEIKYIYITATHSTPTHTPTPTVTPTQTPTALPIDVSGDLRLPRLTTPEAVSGAACGVVDILDFPIDPPDAENALGGGDYGVYRTGYNGYHTGEDWWVSPGTSFGEPVYSIGHGVVTYAAPLGWGADKGTVIVQHTFPDGSQILSFYGHLDPPSVTIRSGECVSRGDKLGEIGQPRTPPHLHFEIRTIYPYQPTRGYVSMDPTELGWKPPSQTIFDYRNRTSPGILWMRPSTAVYSKPLGIIEDTTLIVANGIELTGIDPATGSILWVEPITNAYRSFVLDQRSPTIYTVNHNQQLTTFQLRDTASLSQPSSNAIEMLWQKDLGVNGEPIIMPLPEGGVVISIGDQLIGHSAGGDTLWEKVPFPTVEQWNISAENLFISTGGDMPGIWNVTNSGPILLVNGLSGKAVAVHGNIWIYNKDGIYQLASNSNEPVLSYPLPRAFPALGDMIPLQDGGVLVAHTDIFDRRLIALSIDGSLQWQYSYSHALPGQPFLLSSGDQAYLMAYSTSSSLSRLAIFEIGMEGAALTRLFQGAARRTSSRATWVFALDKDQMLFNMGGSNMFLLDTNIAKESRTADSP